MTTTETYRGINIEIENDDIAENPFEVWDGCMPLITNSGRHGFISDYSKGDIVNYLRDYLTYNQVKRNHKRIIDMMNKDVDSRFHYTYEDFKADYPEDRTEHLKDTLLYEFLDTNDFDNLEKFCIEFGIKHYKGTSTGYSKSDWADVFMCWTPEFEKITGRTYESIDEKDFENALDLFSAWAWGDVYWYNIEDEENHVGSCGGFYGDDHDKSGLLEGAKSEIDYYLSTKKKERENKLKTLIANHVPLQNRQQILSV